MHFAQDNNLRFVLTSHAKSITLQHDTCFFTERVWCRLHPEGADWGERLQHVRISQVEAWEATDVCGSERPGEADERKENPKEEHSHTFSSNCCVNLCTRLERDNMKLWKCEVYNSEKWEISHLILKEKGLTLSCIQVVSSFLGDGVTCVFTGTDAMLILFLFFVCAKQFAAGLSVWCGHNRSYCFTK